MMNTVEVAEGQSLLEFFPFAPRTSRSMWVCHLRHGGKETAMLRGFKE